MLLFDDSKKLEKALGEEAAAVLVHVFERADEKWRQELATKADLMALENRLIERIAGADNRIAAAEVRIAAAEVRILRWMTGGFIAQTALLVAIMAFLK